MMLKKIALALMLACGLSHAQTTTTYRITDDGYVNVPLPFNFNLYGQTFNNSWMYDNGIVSFLKPGTPGAVSPWQWQAPSSLGLSDAKYYIAALWADIAPNAKTVYSTTTDGTYMKYSWNNISEYYSGGTRLSSFSATINSDGKVTTSYYSLNLQTSNVIAGVVGDPSKGEVYQTYSAPFGTQITTSTLPNWTYSPYNPCTDNPLYSTTCPGYNDAFNKLTNNSNYKTASSTNIAPTTSGSEDTTTTIVSVTAPISSGTSSSTPNAISNSNTNVTTQRNSTSTNNSTALSLVARNQQREQNITGLAVQNAIAGADAAALAAQQEAMNTASASITGSSTSAINTIQLGSGIRISTNTQTNMLVNQGIELSGNNQTYSSYNNMLTDRTNPLNDYVEHRSLTNNQPTINASVNRNVGNNDVAGGVDLTRMATTPNGYNDYLNLTLKDVAFYQPKEVYKNQKNVDNARLLRQLTNDSKHRDMVEEQYRR